MKKIVSDILKKYNEKFHKDNEVQLVVTKATMRQYLYFKGIMVCIMALLSSCNHCVPGEGRYCCTG